MSANLIKTLELKNLYEDRAVNRAGHELPPALLSAKHEISLAELIFEFNREAQPQKEWIGTILEELGDRATPAIPVLLEMLESYDVNERRLAARTLYGLTCKNEKKLLVDEQICNSFIKLLESSHSDLREWGARAMGYVQQAPIEIVNRLIELLKDVNSSVYYAAEDSLAKLANQNVQCVIQLINNLNDSDSAFVTRVVTALGKAGKSARIATPRLISLFDHNPDSNHRTILDALRKINTQTSEASKFFVKYLCNEANPSPQRQIAASALGSYAPQLERQLVSLSEELLTCSVADKMQIEEQIRLAELEIQTNVAALAYTLKDSDRGVVVCTMSALGNYAQRSIAILPQYQEAFYRKDFTDTERYIWYSNLSNFGHEIKVLLPEILMGIDSAEPSVRGNATLALLASGSPAISELVEGYAKNLTHPFPHVRALWVNTLGKLGQAAKSALAEIQKIADNDSNQQVREDATQAILNIKNNQKDYSKCPRQNRDLAKIPNRKWYNGPALEIYSRSMKLNEDLANDPYTDYLNISAEQVNLNTNISGFIKLFNCKYRNGMLEGVLSHRSLRDQIERKSYSADMRQHFCLGHSNLLLDNTWKDFFKIIDEAASQSITNFNQPKMPTFHSQSSFLSDNVSQLEILKTYKLLRYWGYSHRDLVDH
jgi:HEAT repeat protein